MECTQDNELIVKEGGQPVSQYIIDNFPDLDLCTGTDLLKGDSVPFSLSLSL